ncbi:unnamed protein product [Caenorhabditis angaria]|uniref:Lipid-binding serum glycoprotein N-terminal domain-containing protein n=1 Tax=Caenorhabditis angaria TaxID=860376 RepID=A0A9P1MWB9_9PELO|nr:unnamed protein product [Caenorhabditis angaria]
MKAIFCIISILIFLKFFWIYSNDPKTKISEEPGTVKIRINKKVLPVAEIFIQKQINNEVPNFKIPEIHEKKCRWYGCVRFNSNVWDVIEYHPPQINHTYSTLGFAITTNGGMIRFKSHYVLKYYIPKFTGWITIKAEGINFKTILSLYMVKEKYQIRLTSCDVSINDLKMRNSGGSISDIINHYLPSVARDIQRTISGRACSELQNNINKVNNILLNSSTIDIGKGYKLNYELIEQPVYSRDYVEFVMKLKFLYEEKRTIITTNLGFSYTSKKCSVDVFNNFLDIAHHNLMAIITKDNPEIASNLRTSCEFFSACIGDLFPKLGKLYPNNTVDILIHTKSKPNITFANDGIKLDIDLFADIFINPWKNNTKSLARLSIKPSIITINAIISKSKLFIDVKQDISFEIDEVFSEIGSISWLVSFIFKLVLKSAVQNFIRGYAEQGFEIPNWQNLSIAEPSKILTSNDTIFFDTDLTNL